MLKTLFNFRGQDYKGNRIPDTFENLKQAAIKIKSLYLQ